MSQNSNLFLKFSKGGLWVIYFFFFLVSLLQDYSLWWDRWRGTLLLYLTRPCLYVVHRNGVEPLALGRVLIWVEDYELLSTLMELRLLSVRYRCLLIFPSYFRTSSIIFYMSGFYRFTLENSDPSLGVEPGSFRFIVRCSSTLLAGPGIIQC